MNFFLQIQAPAQRSPGLRRIALSHTANIRTQKTERPKTVPDIWRFFANALGLPSEYTKVAPTLKELSGSLLQRIFAHARVRYHYF
jgi:hypothetical protein